MYSHQLQPLQWSKGQTLGGTPGRFVCIHMAPHPLLCRFVLGAGERMEQHLVTWQDLQLQQYHGVKFDSQLTYSLSLFSSLQKLWDAQEFLWALQLSFTAFPPVPLKEAQGNLSWEPPIFTDGSGAEAPKRPEWGVGLVAWPKSASSQCWPGPCQRPQRWLEEMWALG